MTKLRVDDVLDLLPDLEELRPLADRILTRSRPDETRRWAASGELGTVGQRLVPLSDVAKEVGALSLRIGRHLEGVYRGVLSALEALQDGEKGEAVDALLRLGQEELGLRRMAAAAGYARSAIELARTSADRRRTGEALLLAARAARGAGDFEGAKAWYGKAFRLARQSGDSEQATTAAVGSGNVLVDQGLWNEAKEWYERALSLLDTSGYEGPQRWHAYLNLSIVHRMLGETEACRRWLDEAEEAYERWPEDAGPALIANARGQLFQALGQPAVAEGYFRKAVERAADPDGRVAMRVNLGEALVERSRLLEAGEEARLAEREALLDAVFPRLPEVYRLLGRIAGARGVDDGFVFFERALEVVRSRELPRFELAQTLEAYGEFEILRGRGKEGAERLGAAAEIYEELGSHALWRRAAAKVPAPQRPPERGADHE